MGPSMMEKKGNTTNKDNQGEPIAETELSPPVAQNGDESNKAQKKVDEEAIVSIQSTCQEKGKKTAAGKNKPSMKKKGNTAHKDNQGEPFADNDLSPHVGKNGDESNKAQKKVDEEAIVAIQSTCQEKGKKTAAGNNNVNMKKKGNAAHKDNQGEPFA